MSVDVQTEEKMVCSEVLGENLENALLDYVVAERTAGKYRCRECGLLFDTLEEHDLHQRQVHGLDYRVALAGLPL